MNTSDKTPEQRIAILKRLRGADRSDYRNRGEAMPADREAFWAALISEVETQKAAAR